MGRLAMEALLERLYDADFSERCFEPFMRELGRRLRALSAQNHACRDALDRLDQPLVLVSAQGTVAFANQQAQRLEAEGRCLLRRQGRLAAVHPADDALLQAALARVLSGNTGGGQCSMPLHARDGAVLGLVTICPVTEPVLDPWGRASVGAALFIRSLAPRRLAEGVRDAFGLTAAEFRLANLLMQGLAPAEAAGRLGITTNTVRTQLRGLFDKTGTRRQPELVALLHRAS